MEKFDLTYPRGLLEQSRVVVSAAFQGFNASRFTLALLYLAALILAEILTAFVEPRAGLVLYGLIFVLLLVHGSLSERDDLRKFLLSLALVPLIRLLSLSLPLRQFPLIYWYLVIGIPLLAAALLTARQLNLRFHWMAGLDRSVLPSQIAVGVLGILLGFVGYLILQPDPLVAEFRLDLLWKPVLILLIFTGFLEEVIFRGLMQQTSQRIMGIWGVLYVAVLFAVMHLIYRSVLEVVFIFGIALIFGIVVLRTGSIIGVSVSHGLMNVFLFLVFPFLLAAPKSQLAVPQTILAPAPVGAEIQPEPLIPDTGTTENAIIPTTTICTFPTDWDLYNVQKGDTWSELSQTYGLSIDELILANCLEGESELIAGQWLFVPKLPTPTLIRLGTKTSLPAWNPSSTPTPKETKQKPSSKPSSNTPSPTQIINLPTMTPTQQLPTELPVDTPTPRSTPTLAPTQPFPTHSPAP